MGLGVHEFLLKPTSPKALRDRLLSILVRPRPMVQIGKLYVPPAAPAGDVGRVVRRRNLRPRSQRLGAGGRKSALPPRLAPRQEKARPTTIAEPIRG